MATDQATDRPSVSIVGIGASAGGIEALRSLFAALPTDLGHAYVVILHLSPDYRSESSGIIARHTGMPVCEVRGSIDLEPDHVYVIPPNCKLEISDSSISASEFDQPYGQRVAIDTFFCSLAEERGDKFAVILSGVGTDGALGARAIKERGGLILVQDPAEALHPSLPEAAIATGAADVIGPVEELAEKLVELTQNRQKWSPILRSANKEKPLGKKATEQVRIRRAQQRGDAMASTHNQTAEEVHEANEELRSVNEAYRVVTEELRTSEEELKRVNEELRTLNTELQLRLEETDRARGDLKNLMSATNIPTLFLDRNLCIQLFTRSLTEIFNVNSRDEGRAISDLTHTLDYAEFQDDAREVLRTQSPFELEVESRKGQTLIVRMIPYRTADKNLDGVVITFVDISRAKQAEIQLRRNQEQLEAELHVTQRLHHMSMSVATAKNQQQAMEEILAAAMELLAADFGAMQKYDQAAHRFETVVHQGFNVSLMEQMESISTSEGSATMRAVRKNASVRIHDIREDDDYGPLLEMADKVGYRSIQVTPLAGMGGAVIGFLCMLYRKPHEFIDRHQQLTDLVAGQAAQLIVSSSQQQQLAELNDELIERMNVIEANEAILKKLTVQLREQDAAKEDFLSLLGHELRNPLAAIRNSLEAMQQKRYFEAEDAALRSGSFDIIDRQSRHMIRLVNDLLDINRINRGKLELSLESIDIRECIEHATKALGTSIREANLNLELDLPESELRVRGDPERMLQILDNLLRNAIQFTDRGGRVLIRARQENGKGHISIKDSGIGMVPEQIESLFEPYKQVETGRHAGLGLGLTLSRRLVELQGGMLSAHSDGPGKGAEFVIELELADASECASPKYESGESASPPQWRVLVVDDDGDNAQSMSILLESLGQKTRVALDGESALVVAREFKPHIVFLDLSMPGMNGHEVASRLRSEVSADWPLKLVALSGHAHKTTPVNFDHYVMKPAAFGDILDLLDSLSRD